MKKAEKQIPFAVLLVIALAVVCLLPLYMERTSLHVMFAHGGGGTIEWGWKRCTLRTFFSDYRYFRSDPHPELWIAMNIALALTYALVMAFLLDRLLVRKPKGP
jgi:hypothetical protein